MGQTARLTLAPDREFAFAILTNAYAGSSVIQDVSRWINKTYLGIESADGPEPLGASIEQLKPFVGKYWRPYMDVEIGTLGGRLIGQTIFKAGFPTQNYPPLPSPPPTTLDLIEEDRLIALDGPLKSNRCEFIRKADGSIGWLRMMGRIHKRIE